MSITGEKSLGYKVTDLPALHLPEMEIAIFIKSTNSSCLTQYRFVAQFVKHESHFISNVLQTVQHCLTYCETKIKIILQSGQIRKCFL